MDIAQLKPIATTYVKPDGQRIRLRSRMEGLVAWVLDLCETPWVYEPESFLLTGAVNYRPDFYCTDIRTWIEVRGYDSPTGQAQIDGFTQYLAQRGAHEAFLCIGPDGFHYLPLFSYTARQFDTLGLWRQSQTGRFCLDLDSYGTDGGKCLFAQGSPPIVHVDELVALLEFEEGRLSVGVMDERNEWRACISPNDAMATITEQIAYLRSAV